MKRITTLLENLAGGVGVYVFTLMGVMLSQYVPLLLREGPINTPFQWIRFGISACIALYLVATDEGQGDPDGKAKNWKKRLANGFKEGFTWNGLMGIAGTAAGQ